MWATGRYSLGLSEEEFWEMSPGMWSALHEAHLSELKVYDAFQARITTMIRATAMSQKKARIKEEDYRFFGKGALRPKKSTSDLKTTFAGIVAIVNARNAAREAKQCQT